MNSGPANPPSPPTWRLSRARAASFTLFLVVIAAAIYFVPNRGDRTVERDTSTDRTPVQAIEDMGGVVTREDSGRMAITMHTATDGDLRSVAKVAHVVSLNLSNSSVTDQGLRQLREMTGLEVLKLDNTAITDSGLEHLSSLERLGSLSAAGTEVTGTALANLTGLRNLRILRLDGSPIRNETLAHLATLNQLGLLYLNGPPIDTVGSADSGDRPQSAGPVTDAGLKHLHGLQRLRILEIRNNQVTDAAVAKLQESLPNCRIDY